MRISKELGDLLEISKKNAGQRIFVISNLYGLFWLSCLKN